MFGRKLVSKAMPSVTAGRRRLMSTESNLKQAREARRAQAQSAKKGGVSPAALVAVAATGVLGYVVYDIRENPKGLIGALYYNSPLEKVVSQIYKMTFGRMEDIFEPSTDKLLPDFPNSPMYAGLPPGTPCPPTLVLDLEKTLIGSTYDTRYGWRHVKRPGLDKFINIMSQYYEIVILSDNDMGVVQDIFMAIDPEGRCHKHGNSALEARGVTMLKRLDLMNRDLGRIILVDDNPESFELFPRNTLQIKPFNVEDRVDNELTNLIPLLQAFVHEDIKDFRDAIDSLGTHDAEEAATEYRMRLHKRKSADLDKRHRGLGKLIHGDRVEDLDDGSVISTVLSPKDIVGGKFLAEEPSYSLASNAEKKAHIPLLPGQKELPTGPSVKKKGALFSYLDEVEKNKSEDEMRKREKMNELYMKRQAEKAQ